MVMGRRVLRILVALVLVFLGVQLALHSRPAAGAWMEHIHFGIGLLEALGAGLFLFTVTAPFGGSLLLLSIGTAFGIHAAGGQMPINLFLFATLVVFLSPAPVFSRASRS